MADLPKGSERPAAPSGKLLIVDDEEPNRQLLSALLGAQGYRPLIARDGPSAIEIIASETIDLVLLDVMMPGMDGIEVCRRVREQLNDRDVTIVFVTALSDRESRMRAKAAGANDFLVKPIDSYELTFRVGNWMKLRSFSVLARERDQLHAQVARLTQRGHEAAAELRALSAECAPDLHQRLVRCAETLSSGSEEPT